ncbi:uncharacterized protein [Antedon mediterranea]|uniref:uncharacterized protein n=1 Tax=Antedon mediterranea TaxID=105859 RepID=UPI003AF7B74B
MNNITATVSTALVNATTTLLDTVTTGTDVFTEIGTVTELTESVLNSTTTTARRLCSVDNLITCIHGSCYETNGLAHCVCLSNYTGKQCELYDASGYNFNHFKSLDSLQNVNKTMVFIGIIFVASLLITVLGVYAHLKYRKSIRNRTVELGTVERSHVVFEMLPSDEKRASSRPTTSKHAPRRPIYAPRRPVYAPRRSIYAPGMHSPSMPTQV